MYRFWFDRLKIKSTMITTYDRKEGKHHGTHENLRE